MAVTKKKTYIFAPTYMQINSILSKGWKLSFVDSNLCQQGEVVSISQEACNGFSAVFERCDENEEYYCLQRFIYYTLWTEEEYTKAIEEIEDYRKQGAYIIATLSCGKTFLTWSKEIVPPLLSVLKTEKVDVLYYIIVPKEHVREQDERYSAEEMKRYLGFRAYPDIVCRLAYLPCVICCLYNIFTDEGLFLAYLNWSSFLVFFMLFCLGVRDIFWFFIYKLYRRKYSFRYIIRRMEKSEG